MKIILEISKKYGTLLSMGIVGVKIKDDEPKVEINATSWVLALDGHDGDTFIVNDDGKKYWESEGIPDEA